MAGNPIAASRSNAIHDENWLELELYMIFSKEFY
ncbi:hypothetical protein CCACVL1_14450 [Corchorus capsularis]|uniref:Uncharacterized protein n=1 Tax=Corchorus capsularis TaxID=210143 RepID=A0A1R3I720_COCAP|nr:hypothetical protein CCACVL1_14450 [Corchorus capsularis]